jgi:beta-galactosidase
MSACAGKVQLWTAETPAVYCLVMEVRAAEGAGGTHVEAAQVAFRHSCIEGGLLKHNGQPVMLRGVNRHEHDAYTGKVSLAFCVNLTSV